jgi:hypothetical protein
MKNIYLLPEMGIIPSLSQKEEVIIPTKNGINEVVSI